MGETTLKRLYPKSFQMTVNEEWDDTNNIMVTQEEKYSKKYQEEIYNI